MVDYTDLAKVKIWAGIRAADTTRDAKLTAQIPRATSYIDLATGRNFQAPGSTDTTEVIKLKQAQSTIYPKCFPIISVTEIKEDTLLLAADLDYSVVGQSIERLGGDWIQVPYAITIKYKGGYTTVPAVIEQCANEITTIFAGEKTKTYTNNEGVEQTVYINEVPDWVKDALKAFRVPRVG